MDAAFRRVIDESWIDDWMEEWRDWGHCTVRAKWNKTFGTA